MINTHPNLRRGRPAGVAYLAALLLLVVLVALGWAIAGSAGLTLATGDGYRHATDARLAAESGLSLLLQHATRLRLPAGTDETNFADRMADKLGQRLDGAVHMDGQTVASVDGVVVVPPITVEGKSFSAQIAWVGENRCRVLVTGVAGGVSRRVSIECDIIPVQPAAFEHGLVSLGAISIGGNAQFIGVNDPSEGSVVSAAPAGNPAITLGGGAVISGSIGVTGDPSSVAISGSPSIGGSTDPNVYADSVHFSVPCPEFPALDTADLIAMAVNVVDASTNTSSNGLVFDNIRIAAGTNPVFSSDIVINGVVYVEAPNIVEFSGKATLNGMIVTQDNDLPISDCQLRFSGQVDCFGVEALPDTPEFAAVKEQTGTFIVAPGFGVTFSGKVNAVNGHVAADEMTFTGTAEGTIRGSLLGLKNRPTSISGNVQIRVDLQSASPSPAGFAQTFGLTPDKDSYTEVTGP